MNGLEEAFSEEIDFIWLNVDDPSTQEMREKYGIVRRTSYVLVNTKDEIVMRWFGPLYGLEMEFEIADWLEAQV